MGLIVPQLNNNSPNKIQSSLCPESILKITLFETRSKMHKNVFKPLSWQIVKSQCQIKSNIKVDLPVYTRISKIKTSQIDTLYLLLSMLYGYAEISKHLINTCFTISIQMIVLDSQGQVKVWLNQDFTQNEPIRTWQSTNPQKVMVKQIFDIIQKNSERFLLPNLFLIFKKQNLKVHSFAEAIILIKKFARLNSFRIPLRIQVVPSDYVPKTDRSVTKMRRKQAITVTSSPLSRSPQFRQIKSELKTTNLLTQSKELRIKPFASFVNKPININSSLATSTACSMSRHVRIESESTSVRIYQPNEEFDRSLLKQDILEATK